MNCRIGWTEPHCRSIELPSCSVVAKYESRKQSIFVGIRQGTWIVICPGWVIWMTPPQLHMHFDVLLSAGMLAT